MTQDARGSTPESSTESSTQYVLGIGTGRCGTKSLAQLLNAQPDAAVTHEDWPLLPWSAERGEETILTRLSRYRRTRPAKLVGDVASFYLPYLEAALRRMPQLKVVCLQRPRADVVRSFCEWLDRTSPLPTNHWAVDPGPDWFHDFVYTRMFPKYDTKDREEGIGRYWDEYQQRVEDLAARYPDRVRVFDTEAALNTPAGMSELLTFVGVPQERQVFKLGHQSNQVEKAPVRRRKFAGRAGDPNDPRKCVILTPHQGNVVSACDNSLRVLEQRGYSVRRVSGYSAIDVGRSQIATDLLREGFEETMWIDSDTGFHPDAIDKLRAHQLPIVCGIYAKKGPREFACHIGPGIERMMLGEKGGLYEVVYAGTGFLHVRRQVYMDIFQKLRLPTCNERFSRLFIPFFAPLIRAHDEASWYLAEDYAFSHRARLCGYRIMADTTIRLWHYGQYGYGWEDAGVAKPRYGSFEFSFKNKGGARPSPAAQPGAAADGHDDTAHEAKAA